MVQQPGCSPFTFDGHRCLDLEPHHQFGHEQPHRQQDRQRHDVGRAGDDQSVERRHEEEIDEQGREDDGNDAGPSAKPERRGHHDQERYQAEDIGVEEGPEPAARRRHGGERPRGISKTGKESGYLTTAPGELRRWFAVVAADHEHVDILAVPHEPVDDVFTEEAQSRMMPGLADQDAGDPRPLGLVEQRIGDARAGQSHHVGPERFSDPQIGLQLLECLWGRGRLRWQLHRGCHPFSAEDRRHAMALAEQAG